MILAPSLKGYARIPAGQGEEPREGVEARDAVG